MPYDFSEKYDTPVILRTTTRLSHSQGLVELEDRVEPIDIPYERDVAKYVMMPGNAIKRHLVVEARMKQMAEDASVCADQPGGIQRPVRGLYHQRHRLSVCKGSHAGGICA